MQVLQEAPFCGACSHSDKPWKRQWHGEMRAALRTALRHFDADRDFLLHDRQASDPWESCKESKIRFDPREHPKWMRK